MKFDIDFGQSYKFQLENNLILDISIYQHRWFTTINMSVWEKDNPVAKGTSEKSHFNYERILPYKISEKICKYLVNKQSQKVAGIDLV